MTTNVYLDILIAKPEWPKVIKRTFTKTTIIEPTKKMPFTCFIISVIIRQTQYEKISGLGRYSRRFGDGAATSLGKSESFSIPG